MMIFKRLISVIVSTALGILGLAVFMLVVPFYWIVTGKETSEWSKASDRWQYKLIDWQDEFVKEKKNV